MLDKYFHQYEQIISPKLHIPNGLTKQKSVKYISQKSDIKKSMQNYTSNGSIKHQRQITSAKENKYEEPRMDPIKIKITSNDSNEEIITAKYLNDRCDYFIDKINSQSKLKEESLQNPIMSLKKEFIENSYQDEKSNLKSELNNLNSNQLFEIVKSEKKKNMIFRQQVNELKNRISLIENNYRSLERKNEILNKEKIADSNYLMKLENMISKLKNEQLSIDTIKSLSTSESSDAKLKCLQEENIKLKEFRSKIFGISQKSDEVNINILNSLNDIEEIFLEIKNYFAQSNLEKENQEDKNSQPELEILKNLKLISSNFEHLLINNKNEYVFLLSSKEIENKSLHEEIINQKNILNQIRQDRLKDQKMIFDLENLCQVNRLKIKEYELVFAN